METEFTPILSLTGRGLVSASAHLSEIKGPVMDQLADTDFLKHLTGEIFLSQKTVVDRLSQA